MSQKLEIQYQNVDISGQEIERRLFNALSILISEDDINYLNNKSYEDENQNNTLL